MATVVLHECEAVAAAVVKRLTRAAVALGAELGDATDVKRHAPAQDPT